MEGVIVIVGLSTTSHAGDLGSNLGRGLTQVTPMRKNETYEYMTIHAKHFDNKDGPIKRL